MAVKREVDDYIKRAKAKGFTDKEISKRLKDAETKPKIKPHHVEILKQSKKIKTKIENVAEKTTPLINQGAYVLTGIKGFDELIEKGIPKGSSVLIAGGLVQEKQYFVCRAYLTRQQKEKNAFI